MTETARIRTRRTFWIIAIVNWAIAIFCWGLSAYLGIGSPTSIFVYTILFLIALVAVIVGFLAWLVAKFGREVEPAPVAETSAADVAG
jgi:hypothetical protein